MIIDIIIDVLKDHPEGLTAIEIAQIINNYHILAPKSATKEMVDNAIQYYWRNGGESIYYSSPVTPHKYYAL